MYIVLSLNVCHDMGDRGVNSTVCPSISAIEFSTIDFHRMVLKYMEAPTLIRLPDELTMFHIVMELG